MALSSGESNLSDYTNLHQIGKGRFSSVYYAETKVGMIRRRLPGGRGKRGVQSVSCMGVFV